MKEKLYLPLCVSRKVCSDLGSRYSGFLKSGVKWTGDVLLLLLWYSLSTPSSCFCYKLFVRLFTCWQVHSKGLHSSAPWLNVGCQDKMLDSRVMLMLQTDWAEVEEADCQISMQAIRIPCALKALRVSVKQGNESKARQATKGWLNSASQGAKVQTQSSLSKVRQRWTSTREFHWQSKIKESESAWDKAVRGSNSVITMVRWIVKLVNKTVCLSYHHSLMSFS